MRNNVPREAEYAVRKLALRLGKTDQQICNLGLLTGLRELGTPMSVVHDVDDHADQENVKITLVLPTRPYAAASRLAAREGCSKSSKIRDLITIGLKRLGAWDDVA